MKKIFALFVFVFISSIMFAQNNYQDVVYLKNGSIIRGVLIEQVPNKSIKIETADKNVFVYQIDEIEKITKEEIIRGRRYNAFKRRGYIGLSLGASIPVGDFADESNGAAKTGLRLNLIDFGYLFTDNIGIAATWFGAANLLDINDVDPWSYGGLMAGPLLSFSVSEMVDWDFKPMVGYAVTTVPDFGFGEEQAPSFAYSLGTQCRIHVGEKTSLLLNADYFSTKPEFKVMGFEQNIGVVTIGVGIAFRLR